MEVTEVGRVRGHPDRTGQILCTTDRLNVLSNELTMKAVGDSKVDEPKWSKESAPLLNIRGKVIRKNEGVVLSIASEEEEYDE